MNLLQLSGIEDNSKIKTKVCLKCKTEKPILEYAKHTHYHDNLDSTCKTCRKNLAKLRNKLRKNAPPMPKICDCCKTPPVKLGNKKNLCLDHDQETNQFRGWLCEPCNTGMGLLGDNLDSLMMAVEYLKNK